MKRIKPGDVLLIPLGFDMMCFGQALKHGLLVFDYCTKQPPEYVEEITDHPRLIRVVPNTNMERGYWERLGNASIPKDLETEAFYKGSGLGKDLFDLMVNGNIVDRGVHRSLLKGLPRFQVFDPSTIEERLGYHFRGEEDPFDKTYGKLGQVLE